MTDDELTEEPAWMVTARRLEAKHREDAALQIRAAHIASPWFAEQDRKHGMLFWSRLQGSRYSLHRKRPQMDDVREGMTPAERLAYDKGVQDGLLLAAEKAGAFKATGETLAMVGKISRAVFDAAECLLDRYDRRPWFHPAFGARPGEQPSERAGDGPAPTGAAEQIGERSTARLDRRLSAKNLRL